MLRTGALALLLVGVGSTAAASDRVRITVSYDSHPHYRVDHGYYARPYRYGPPPRHWRAYPYGHAHPYYRYYYSPRYQHPRYWRGRPYYYVPRHAPPPRWYRDRYRYDGRHWHDDRRWERDRRGDHRRHDRRRHSGE